jgi:hypothetical protein
MKESLGKVRESIKANVDEIDAVRKALDKFTGEHAASSAEMSAHIEKAEAEALSSQKRIKSVENAVKSFSEKLGLDVRPQYSMRGEGPSLTKFSTPRLPLCAG